MPVLIKKMPQDLEEQKSNEYMKNLGRQAFLQYSRSYREKSETVTVYNPSTGKEIVIPCEETEE